MKRIGCFVLLCIALTATPRLLPATQTASEMASDPLSSATIDAIFKKIESLGHYHYTDLTNWYSQGRVTITQNPNSYTVTITDDDGSLDVLILDTL